MPEISPGDTVWWHPDVVSIIHTGEPRYLREIGTSKIGLHITNLHMKRPRITINLKTGSRKMAISQLHICKIADKKAKYNEGCQYNV